MNDFDFQFEYVCSQIPRLVSMQDSEPTSPSFGCFHYNYWRDKTSEFPDGRFQEAGATLALLSHPTLYSPRLGLPPAALRQRFLASLACWRGQQHSDGSFDEWYKHEHGFAATTFTLIANGLAMHFIGDSLEQEAKENFNHTAKKAADWLLTHDDMVKTNHQMAGAAALALAAKLFDNSEYRAGAMRKHGMALSVQNEEGWFNEIAGMDLGYCSVLLDYAMLYRHFSNDDSGVEAMKKLMQFFLPFVQPDLTVSPESGLCLNPYVSRLGTLLLSDASSEAQALSREFFVRSNREAGVTPTLADDVRLCRWSYLPLITKLVLEDIKQKGTDLNRFPILADVQASGSTVRPKAKIVSLRARNGFAVFLPCVGGLVRAFAGPLENQIVFEDYGYLYGKDGSILTTRSYDLNRRLDCSEPNQFTTEVEFLRASFFFPGFLSRLALRILGSIPGAAYWLRKAIDFYRRSRRTAMNQSAAPLKGQKSVGLKFLRSIQLIDGTLRINDEFVSQGGGAINLDDLQLLAFIKGEKITKKYFPAGARCRSLKVSKSISLENGDLNVVVDKIE